MVSDPDGTICCEDNVKQDGRVEFVMCIVLQDMNDIKVVGHFEVIVKVSKDGVNILPKWFNFSTIPEDVFYIALWCLESDLISTCKTL